MTYVQFDIVIFYYIIQNSDYLEKIDKIRDLSFMYKKTCV